MLEQKKKEADYWGRFSDTYDDNIERIFGTGLRENLARVLENEHGLGNAVEFGCGTGYFTRTIAKNADHVTATDISPKMIGVARARLKDPRNVTFLVEDSERTSLPSGSFDAALMANMLHTLDDPLKALEECYRVLKDGGTLLIINYTGEGMGRVERTLLFFRFALKFGLPPGGHWPITSDKLRSLLRSAGFRVERLELIEGKINALYARAKKAGPDRVENK
jgi:ABC-2 type transport system ATP-binding protein